MTRKNFYLLLIGTFLLGNSVFAQKPALVNAEELLEKEMIDSAIFYFETALVDLDIIIVRAYAKLFELIYVHFSRYE